MPIKKLEVKATPNVKTTSSAKRLFASQDIHKNNCINTEVQKQNET